MSIRNSACAIILLSLTAIRANAAEPAAIPETAKTTAEILERLQCAKGFGIISTAEFHYRGGGVFVAWYDPFSGRAACFVHVWTFDPKQDGWTRRLSRTFEGISDVSVEYGGSLNGLTLRNHDGDILYPEKKQKKEADDDARPRNKRAEPGPADDRSRSSADRRLRVIFIPGSRPGCSSPADDRL